MNQSKAISFAQIICALLIVNYHTGKLAIPFLSRIAKLGFVLNTVFVFLSGYLLTQSLLRKKSSSFRAFMFRRLNRIYPSLHISIFLIFIFYLLTNKDLALSEVLYSASGFCYFFSCGGFGGGHLWFVSVILICYLFFIPTYWVLNHYPYQFMALALGGFISLTLFRYGSLDGIYNRVSSDAISRFLYHYLVFSLATLWGIKNSDFKSLMGKKYIGIFFVSLPLYAFFLQKSHFGLFAIGFAFMVALCVLSIALMAYPLIDKYIPQIMILSPITYELYLVHYSVIDTYNAFFHGKYIGYPMVFITSILFAFFVSYLSKSYSRLTKYFTGWLNHQTS